MSRTRQPVPKSGHRRRAATVQRTAVRPRVQDLVQRAALTVGKPGDRYEQEADRIADSVVQKAAADHTGTSQDVDDASVQMMTEEDTFHRKMDDTSSDAEVQRSGDEPEVQTQEIHENAEDKAGTVRREAEDGDEAADVQAQSEIHEAEEDKAGAVRRESDGRGQAAKSMEDDAGAAVRDKGEGESLDPGTQRTLERHMDLDLSGVRIHRDTRAQSDAKKLKAKAFANKNHIWLGAGQSPHDLRLMAHEITHTRQQRAVAPKSSASAPPALQRETDDSIDANVQLAPVSAPVAPASPAQPGDATTRAPGTVELKGKPGFSPDPAIADWLAGQPKGTGNVRVRFGSLAEGDVKVQRRGGKAPSYRIRNESIPVATHPWLTDFGAKIGAQPKLFLNLSSSGKLDGYVGLQKSRKLEKREALMNHVKANAEAFGLPGFQFPKTPKITNRLEDGALAVELADVPVRLGRVFDGMFTVKLADESIRVFEGQVKVSVPGLATGDLALKRNEKGLITGKAGLGVEFPQKNISGEVVVEWDGVAVTGMGKVGYQGEKMSGSITLNLMEKNRAYALTEEKKAPADSEKSSAGSQKTAKALDMRRLAYVLFGEGDLEFSFTEWLTGTAQVIVDPKGYTTIIGKITPQKEFELFPQKDYNRHLFKVEARARYGLPVVGNIFIFANVGMDAFAKIGPGKFYKIEVNGTYSTDPKKLQNFSIQGTLNISAAAGLKLRGEAGAGLEILAHDIKAGAGVNAIAGVRGYTEATPIIGYREKATQGEDKKGEFFVRGEFEIVAQPFLGLGGDLFVEVDAPWWSPVPDKKWTWPLGSKEYPLPGQFGVGADVDYVFGSGKAPTVDFKKVDFAADKFLTDLYSDKAAPKSGSKEPKKGAWKEKNAKAAEPPAKADKKGGAQSGKLPTQKPAQATVKAGGPKRKAKAANPNSKTASGKLVKDYQKDARKKGGKPDAGKAPKSAKGQSESSEKEAGKKELAKGLAALRQLDEKYEKDGATLGDMKVVVKSVRRKYKRAFKKLEVRKVGNGWKYFYVASPEQEEDGPPVLDPAKQQELLETKVKREKMSYSEDLPGRARAPSGHVQGVKDKEGRDSMPALAGAPGYQQGDHKGHLIGDRFKGPSNTKNLVPMHQQLNLSTFKTFENAAAKAYQSRKNHAKLLYMRIEPKYPSKQPNSMTHYRPTHVTPNAHLHYLDGEKAEKEKIAGSGKQLDNPAGGKERSPVVVLASAEKHELVTIPGIGPTLADRILQIQDQPFSTDAQFAKKVDGLSEQQLKKMRQNYFHPIKLFEYEKD